jgi:hypothetical protein
MKTLIATAALALTVTAPAFADVSVAQQLALYNDSAAERVLSDPSSGGDTQAIALWAAQGNSSAAETIAPKVSDVATRNTNLLSFFAMGNDSAAEQIVR